VNEQPTATTLTFTGLNYYVPQTVILSTFNDTIDYGTSANVTLTHTAVSSDPLYNTGAARFYPSAVALFTVFDNYVACRRSCNPGYYWIFNDTGTECVPCPAGSSCPGGCGQPSLCPTGSSSLSGSPSCSACPVGRYGVGQMCYDCPLGTFANTPATIGSCSACTPGWVATTIGMSNCAACYAGFYSVDATLPCIKCSSRYIAPLDGATSCSFVGNGYSANHNNTAAVACRIGEYSDDTTSSCMRCAAGRYNNATNATLCLDCQPTQWSPVGVDKCLTCQPGYESNSTNGIAAPNCRRCAAGTYSDVNMTSCAVCSNGTVPDSTQTYCIPCLAGYYDLFNATARDRCYACPNGTYQNATAWFANVETLPLNTSSSDVSELIAGCTFCELGRANAVTGASSCGDCPGGTVAEVQGQAVCTGCSTVVTAAGVCLSCLDTPGYIAKLNASNMAACEACPAGYYQDDNNCIACNATQYAPGMYGHVGQRLYLCVVPTT
jgi:hypothetical protein